MIRARMCHEVARRAALAAVAVCLVGARAKADSLYAFGDSLLDTGNVFARFGDQLPPSPPYFGGRFSNGPVFVEVLAEQLGLAAPTPSLLGGTNYAFGSARTGPGTSNLVLPGVTQPLPVDNLGLQVDTFLGSLGAPLRPTDLVVINGGGNDFFEALRSGSPFDPAGWAGNLASSIGELAGVGGRRFLVANLPLLGQTPAMRALEASVPGLTGQLNALSALFNQALSAHLDALEADPGLALEIFRLDLAAITSAAVADPARFGFSNVTAPALFTPGADPSAFLFWDDVHPTAAGHRLIGQAAAQLVIPEPSSLILSAGGAALGLLVVSVSSGRRRRAG